MPDSTLDALTAATAATGGLYYGTQGGADRKFTVTAAGATLVEAANAAAQRSALGVSTISTPQIYYVETNGNNATAEVGNPAKPYLTAQAAYDAGVGAATSFVLELGVGNFVISTNGDTFSGHCRAVNGQGGGFSNSSYATLLDIDTRVSGGGGATTNNNGTTAGSVGGEFNSLILGIVATGQGVTVTDTNSYTAGDGGTVYIQGTAQVYYINTRGGSSDGSTDGDVTGGNGGSITILSMGPFLEAVIDNSGGSGYGMSPLNGSDGPFTADGTDLRNYTTLLLGTVTLGRCSYTNSSITITNDKGGNAAW